MAGMSLTDYLLNLALIGLVVVQLRGRRLTTRALVMPLGIVGYAVVHYLHGVPTRGNDLVLVTGAILLGAALGTAAALLTRIEQRDGFTVARATVWAAGLWVLGVGCRMGFALYSTHGGASAIGRFSAAHHITSGEAWVAALVLMSLTEVVCRTGVLAVRGGTIGRLLRPALG